MDVREAEIEHTPEGSPLPVGTTCPECGYDVRELTSARCPECGFGLELLRTQESQIPWNHRKQLGAFRAYWRTVWQVVRWPKRFCTEVVRPVDAADARRFAYVTMLHVWLAVVLGATAVYFHFRLQGWGDEDVRDWLYSRILVYSLVALGLIPIWVRRALTSAALSPERQGRVNALSYYTLAPLAWVPLAVPPLVLGVRLWDTNEVVSLLMIGVTVIIIVVALSLAEGLLQCFTRHLVEPRWWARQRMLLRRSLEGGALGLSFVLVPATLFYLSVIYWSLQ